MEGAPGFPLRGSFPVHGPEDSRVKTERIAAEISHVTEKGRCFGRQGSLWTTSGGRAFGRGFCGRRASRAIAGSPVPPLPNRDHTVPRPDQSPPQIPRTRQFILSTPLRFFFLRPLSCSRRSHCYLQSSALPGNGHLWKRRISVVVSSRPSAGYVLAFT